MSDFDAARLPNVSSGEEPEAAPVARDTGAGDASLPVFLYYFQLAMRWKWLIAGIIAAVLAAGLLWTFVATPQYRAQARIEIGRDLGSVTKVEGVESTAAGRDAEFYQTQYNLLEARSLAARVSKQLRLSQSEEFFDAHGESPPGGSTIFANGPVALTAEDRSERERLAVELLLENFVVSPIRGSALVDVSYLSASPELSAKIVNTWVEQFIQSSIDRRFDSTADAREFLEGRLEELRSRLRQSESDLVDYASRSDIVALSRTEGVDGRTQSLKTLAASELEALSDALVDATAARVAAQSRAAQRAAGAASSESITSPALAELRAERAKLATQYAKLMVQFEPEYPAARSVAEQLEALDSSIAREEARIVGSRQTEYRQALQNEQDLRQRVAALKSRLDNQARASIQYNIFQREADTNRQLYESLLQRYKEIGVAGVAANNISIVDRADVPEKPASPSLPLNLALSLLVGIVLAGGTVFLIDQVDEGLRRPDQVHRELGLPLLGSVPDLGDDQSAIEYLDDVKSELSEAYLAIRSSLAFATARGVPKSIMITSTRPAEGKSTSSFALSTVMARTGSKVLLIDADMRSPSMHGFAEAHNEFGLSNALTGATDLPSLIQSSIRPNLDLLAAGPMPPSASQLLSTTVFKETIATLLHTYDFVVVDGPPILGLADAPLISRAVESAIVVIEADGVPVRGIVSALSRLKNVHASLAGAILTKLDSRDAQYGYGYGYGYSYGSTDLQKAA